MVLPGNRNAGSVLHHGRAEVAYLAHGLGQSALHYGKVHPANNNVHVLPPLCTILLQDDILWQHVAIHWQTHTGHLSSALPVPARPPCRRRILQAEQAQLRHRHHPIGPHCAYCHCLLHHHKQHPAHKSVVQEVFVWKGVVTTEK